ncbi:MAG: lysophospholipase [Acidimicrobiia bacterium]|nr:lysophospholipase [Acidimicrobiia bacterium]MDH3397024.1 lysophospholipase [Acidimicrobiia bacterium]
MVKATDEIGVSASGQSQLRRHWSGDAPAWATVLIVHGGGEHSARYDHVATQMVEAGLDVHSFDWAGHGGSGGTRWHIDVYETYYADLAERISSTRNPGLPFVLYGHSMGGLISLGYCLTRSNLPDLLVATSPWLETAAPALLKAVVPLLAKIAPHMRLDGGLRGEQLARNPAVGEAYFADPLVETKITAAWGAASLREQARVRAGLSKLRVPVFVVHGGADTIARPHASVPIGDLPDAERRLYPSLHHETHNEPEGPEVVGATIEWLRKRVSG